MKKSKLWCWPSSSTVDKNDINEELDNNTQQHLIVCQTGQDSRHYRRWYQQKVKGRTLDKVGLVKILNELRDDKIKYLRYELEARCQMSMKKKRPTLRLAHVQSCGWQRMERPDLVMMPLEGRQNLVQWGDHREPLKVVRRRRQSDKRRI